MTKELIARVNLAAHDRHILSEAAVVNDIGAVDVRHMLAPLVTRLDVAVAVAVIIAVALLEIVAVFLAFEYDAVIFFFSVHSSKFLKVDNRV